MSECLKTGAIVYLAEYGEWVVTDLKQEGDCYHFWIESDRQLSREKPASRVNLVVYRSGGRQAGRELVTAKSNCSVFDYEGVPLQQGTNKCLFAGASE